MRIAFAGNPNSGKTTMFNALTGSNERVGNWAGVTVDKKEGTIKKSFSGKAGEIIAVDLPGAYSMSPFTSEESVTSDYVKNEKPDVIINIVDATNLSRSLFFTTQLLELGVPLVVALNKSDINEKRKTTIDAKTLSKKLNCPVVETISTSSKGLDKLIEKALSIVGEKQTAPYLQGDIDLTDKAVVSEADRKRFEFVNTLVDAVERRKVQTNQRNFQDKIDAVITNKWAGIPIFAVVMFLVFQISQAWVGAWIADGIEGTAFPGLVGYIGMFKELVAGWMVGANDLLQAIVLEGMIEGVGAVVGFLPLVMVMYFLIALLEDCGYMARVSVVLDPIFKKVGLSGKSVIPFVIGTGCAIPGIMACRTIHNERERRATAMLTPFMPCGAKLPVIALFVGAFFPQNAWIGTAMYFLGIILIFLCAVLINKISCYKAKKSFFIIELPEYKLPSTLRAFKSMCGRGRDYIVKAGTIILVCNFVVYLMQNFNWSFKMVDDPNQSILAGIAGPVAYVIAPIVGVVSWKLAAAAVTGFIAKECVVSTLATCFAFGAIMDEEGLAVSESLSGTTVADFMPLTAITALAYLMFNLFSPPCFAAIGAMNSEIKSKKWLFGGIALQLSVGFVVGFLTFFFGSLFTGADIGENWMPVLGWVITAGIIAVVTAIIIINQRKLKAEYELKVSANKKSAVTR